MVAVEYEGSLLSQILHGF